METLGLVWVAKYFRPYLLGYHCVAFTDHSTCTPLLNAAHPCGKLAMWAMVIQELDTEIRPCSGKANSNADALSHNPGPSHTIDEAAVVLSAETMNQSNSSLSIFLTDSFMSPLREISEHQQKDPDLSLIVGYLNNGSLHDDEKRARKLVLESAQYYMVDGVLHGEPVTPGSWGIVVPKELRKEDL